MENDKNENADSNENANLTTTITVKEKLCKHCNAAVGEGCIFCSQCGKQIEQTKDKQSGCKPSKPANNTNTVNADMKLRACNKRTALLLCIFLGIFGIHKLYEGKSAMGILYFFTCGFFFVGWVADIISILFKPDPYYVKW